MGLEVKRELVEGELRTANRAALPAVAVLGGMVVPALIYGAFNAGTDGMRGWAIPLAGVVFGLLTPARPANGS